MESHTPPAGLAPLCDAILAAGHLSGKGLLGALAQGVARADPACALDRVCPQALAEPRGGYSRHVAYADPQGRYTVVYLVWPPGQFSPVHGHHTWCAYRVVTGELTETLYRWDADVQCAHALRQVSRRPGDVVTAAPGLDQVHRLGNAGTAVAVSLHVYGIDAQALTTGVNHVVTSAPAMQVA
ncbi:Cysteine dioxygenase [Bordetella sputigena]|uniref:cysteine dioxygenase family protein n=1 Tax=Bordetella sputigena TaxID=1416810 RepID=UPI0039EE3D26